MFVELLVLLATGIENVFTTSPPDTECVYEDPIRVSPIWSMGVTTKTLYVAAHVSIGAAAVYFFGEEQNTEDILVPLGVLFLGQALRLWCRYELAGSFTYKLAPPEKLVKTGPYRYFAHSGYLGSLMMVMGAGTILLPIIPYFFVIGTTCMSLSARIRDEEAMLYAKFGDEWTIFVHTRIISY